jgi:hypothetical protein
MDTRQLGILRWTSIELERHGNSLARLQEALSPPDAKRRQQIARHRLAISDP